MDESSASKEIARQNSYRRFDEKARQQFLDAIRTGAATTVRAACNLLELNYQTVRVWMRRGKEGHDNPDYERFYLAYESAKAARANVAWHTLVTAAANKDTKAAADLLKIEQAQQRHRKAEERAQALHPSVLAKAEAEAVKAQAEAERAEIQAQLLRQSLKTVNGRLVWAPEIAGMMTEAERLALDGFLERVGMVTVAPEDVQEELEAADGDDLEELEDVLKRHPPRQR